MSDHPAPGQESFSLAEILRHPEQLTKLAPCQSGCAAGTDVRGWIAVIAQRNQLGLDLDEACERAWRCLVETNPFPATTGRICPHPCEAGCNRSEKEGAVAVQALERYLGDWALARGLRLARLGEETRAESVGVVGGGPAGLSFSYQMARRGYPVTVYEQESQAGGMLLRGIPAYRLPESVLAAEIQRIVDLGVELRLGARAGVDFPLTQLRERHDAIFLGIGAQVGRRLDLAGEEGEGCLTGTAYLRAVNDGRAPRLGERVAVVGGGNTAVDAARAARRGGSRVTLLYRRTRGEMPAVAGEVDEALEEGVELVELVAPVAVLREAGGLRGLRLQRMRLGTPDPSGRRRPEPIPGSEHELAVDAVIAAVSQEPDWEGLDGLRPAGGWIPADGYGVVADGVWAGGDARGLGIAGLAISQGRLAAESVHARLRGLPDPAQAESGSRPLAQVRAAFYETLPRTDVPHLPPAERLARPDAEVVATVDEASFLREASRCLSCGSCFGCQHCWMYCNPGGYTRIDEVAPGTYFALDLGACEGCGKCIEVCPCGFLSVS
jgi:NADPH-dependent glutamate synthase beta subunit-like oxidoreductase/ferredoxin